MRLAFASLISFGLIAPALAQDAQPVHSFPLIQFGLAILIIAAVIGFFFWKSRGGPKEPLAQVDSSYGQQSGGGHSGGHGGGD